MNEKTPITRGGLYRHTNPPPSREVALKRLDELETAIGNMSTQLKHPRLDHFGDTEVHERWKRGVLSALSHCQTEALYLKGWLGMAIGGEGVLIVNARAGRKLPEGFHEKLLTLKAQAEGMAVEMRRLYARVYVDGHMPANSEVAVARKQQLVEIGETLRSKLHQLKEEARKSGIGEVSAAGTRKSLTNLYTEWISETKLLSKYLKENKPQNRVEWKAFLLSMVEEAITKGFKPSDEQTQILEDIKSHMIRWTTKNVGQNLE